jgi:hypothetical protein
MPNALDPAAAPLLLGRAKDLEPQAAMHLIEPYHDDEARGVLFEVPVLGRRAQGYISCALLERIAGCAVAGDDAVAAYRRHRPEIDAAVARRAPAEGWETVMLRSADLH